MAESEVDCESLDKELNMQKTTEVLVAVHTKKCIFTM